MSNVHNDHTRKHLDDADIHGVGVVEEANGRMRHTEEDKVGGHEGTSGPTGHRQPVKNKHPYLAYPSW